MALSLLLSKNLLLIFSSEPLTLYPKLLKLSSFNNVKKIALPNWLWESNELSIWSKAE